MKKVLTSTLALLLMLGTLLSLCGILSACNLFTDDDDVPTDPEEMIQESCTHAVTKLSGVREATCASTGFTGNTVCTACGTIVESGEILPMLQHTMDNGRLTKQSTCMIHGITTYSCRECGWEKESIEPLVAHQDVFHDANDSHTHSHTCATCTINNYEDHVPKDDGIFYPATCTEPSYTLHTCKDCNGLYKVWDSNSTILGHSWPKDEDGNEIWQITEPTCCATGLKTRKCLDCGKDESMTLKIAPNAHNYKEFARDNATCVSKGMIYYKCQNGNCGAETTKEIPLNANAHSMSATTSPDGWTTDACQNEGCNHQVKTYTAPEGQTQASVAPDNIDDDRTFEVKTEAASVQFPTDVVAQMKDKNTGNIDIQAGVADNKDELLDKATNLTDDEKARLENVDIFNFSVSGITENFTAGVTVTIPYTLKKIEGTDDYEDPNGIKVWYVAENGNIESFNAVFVPNEGSTTEGCVTFTTTHFSYYAVAYEETQEAKCRRGVHRWMETTEDDVVAPTCTHYGYTVKECDTCHAIIYDNLVEKLSHTYSSLIDPVVDCTNGGYVTKVCLNEGCGHTVNVQYRNPLGHKLNGAATCTEDSVCERCDTIVTPAHGHEWGDWVTIVEPTATKTGLRRKDCTKCGEHEKSKLAATGAVEQISFDSYEDLMETMLETVLAFHNGKVTMVVKSDDNKNTTTMDIKVKEEGESYLMLIDITVNGTSYHYDYNGGESTRTEYQYEDHIQFMYRNGVTVLIDKHVSPYSDYEYNDIYNDLESVFMLPYELMLKYAKQSFDLYAPQAEGTIENLGAVLGIADALAGDAINDVLEEIGSPYTLGSLAELYEKAQAVYTYLALTLGFNTTLEPSSAAIPNANDFMTVLKGFFTVTTDASGNKVYTIDCADRLAEFEAICEWIEEHEESTLSSMLWTLLGSEVKGYYPDINNWNAFVNKMKTTYTGSMLVKDAINTAVDMLERKGICTVKELYDLIGSLLSVDGKPVNVEQMIAKNWDFTLDELARKMHYENLNDLYTKVNAYLTTTKLGELVVDYHYEYDYDEETGSATSTRTEITLTERLDEIMTELDRTAVTGKVSFTLNKEGRLVSFNINTDVDYDAPEGENDFTGGSITLTLERDDAIVIDLPANLQPVSNVKLQSTFDSNGNMLITVPEGFDYTFEIGGYGDIPLSQLIEKDQEMSDSLGITVYALKPNYWDRTVQVGTEYILYNNKYYTCKYTSETLSESYYKITKEVTLPELMADPTSIVRETPLYEKGIVNGTTVTLYGTLLLGRYAFQLNGTWYLAKSCEYSGWNEQLQSSVYNITSYVALADALSGIQVSSISGGYSSAFKSEDGETVSPQGSYFSLNTTAWGTETVSAQVYINENGDIVLIDCEWVSEKREYYYMLGEEIPESDLPAHDEEDVSEWWYSDDVKDAEGNIITENLNRVCLRRKVPTYYVKVNNNTYAGFVYDYNYITLDDVEIKASLPSWIKTDFNEASSKKVVNLPDGNKLFVTGEKPSNGTGAKGQYDSIAWGWAKTNGIYVQAVVRYFGDKPIEVLYRGSSYISDYYGYNSVALSKRTIAFNDHVDLAQYLTKTGDNTYRVSAAFFTHMQSLCTDEGDRYWLRVVGKQTVNGSEYEFEAAVGLYEKAYTLTANNSHSTSQSYVYWYELFGSNSNGAMFSVIPGKKTGDTSSITVRLNNGESINATYSCYNGLYPVTDDVVKYNAEKSEETGLNIYGAVTSYYTNTYVYEDGKYYNCTVRPTYDSYKPTTLDAIKQTVANDWWISNLTYRYDFTDENNNVYPVYQASFRFGATNSYNYSNYTLSSAYVIIKEGKLYVLSGAVEEGASVIRFESMVSPADYFRAAADRIAVREIVNHWNDYTVMIEDQEVKIYNDQILYFHDYNEDGEIACTRYISVPYVLENDTVRYISGVGEYLGDSLIKYTDPVTISNLYGTPEFEDRTYYNGTFTFASVKRANYRYYVKLAGVYYHYESHRFETYYGYCFDQSRYESAMATEQDHYYGVYDEATETWTYYNRMDTVYENGVQYAALSEPITTLPTFTDSSASQTELSIKAKNGETITEFSGLVMGNILAVKRSDGTVFYHKEGSNNGFLKITENKYIRARKITVENSNEIRILCDSNNLIKATLDYNEVKYLDPLSKYLTVSADVSSIKISKAILDAIPEVVRDGFTLTLSSNNGYYGYVTLSYAQLEAWFELTEIKDCGSGHFNGFVDYDKINGEHNSVTREELIYKH